MDVKICGITNYLDARKAISQGAQFLGLVLVEKINRSISDSDAFKLIEKLKKENVHIVGIFEEKNFEKIKQRAKHLNLNYIQIVAPEKNEDLNVLKDFKKFLVIPVNIDGSYNPVTYSLGKDDLWLYDTKTFGQGKTFNWDQFRRKEEGPFFIAGGLNSKNVATACMKLKPNGVDVSSGVCNHTNVEKDHILIKQFIEKVSCYIDLQKSANEI